MKKFSVIMLALAVGFAFVGCANEAPNNGEDGVGPAPAPPTDGILTITGIPSQYNG